MSRGGPALEPSGPTGAALGDRPRGRGRLLARVEVMGSSLCFGLMAVLARKLSQRPGGFTPGHLAVVRFGVGAALSLALFRLRPGLYRPRNLRLLVSRGLSGGAVVILYFFALARIPAGEAGMLYNLFPVVATAMSVFTVGERQGERPTAHLLVGLVLATVGVTIVLGGGALRLGVGWGELAALAAAGFAAASANVIRAMRGTDNAATIFFWFCLAGLPVVLPFALDPWPRLSADWGTAFLMALAAFGAQMLMAQAFGALSVPEASVWLQLTPLAQFALAVPLLGELPTIAALGGAMLGVTGVAYGTILGTRRTTGP